MAIFKAYNGLTIFTTRYPYFLLLNSEDTRTVDLNINHVVDAVEEANKERAWLPSPPVVKGHEKLWEVLKKLKALPSTEDLKKDAVRFEEARELLNELWEYLSESEKPQNATETKPYRVDMHIINESKGHIFARVRARGNDDPPLFNK